MIYPEYHIEKCFREAQKPFLLDGAVGSLLTSSGIKWDENLWSSYANISHPDEVIALHREYITAGADIITTNTFRTNPFAHKQSGIDISLENFISHGVNLAKKSVEKSDVMIAGSNAPAEDCYQAERTISRNELEYNHKKHIEILYESGADFILNETQSHQDEIEIICRFCSDNKIPFALSLFFDGNGRILSGQRVEDILKTIIDYSPLFIGFNCIIYENIKNLIESNKPNFPWGLYLNCGAGDLTDKNISCGISPEHYSQNIKNLINVHTKVIGSCCGSSPMHTASLREMINEIY